MILVIGDILVDIFLLDELKAPEQESGLALRGGGSASNTATWIASTGRDVTLVACPGDDPRGRMLVSELIERGVAVAASFITGMETGAVLVRIGAGGERVMRSSRGANVELSPEIIVATGCTGLRAVHVTGYALLGRYKLDLLAAAAQVAQEQGAMFSFDPSSSAVIESIGPHVLLQALRHHAVDLVLPNADEACTLASAHNIDEAASVLGAVIPTVLIKSGADGALTRTADGIQRIQTQPVSVLDTTGAGDAFNAGALVALTAGASQKEACALGNKLALEAVQILGGRPD